MPSLDRALAMTFPDATSVSTTFDEISNPIQSTQLSGTVTKTHDAVGRTLTEAYPSGTTLHGTWSPIGRLTTVSDGVTTLASFTYRGARPKGATFQNGLTEARTYTGSRGWARCINLPCGEVPLQARLSGQMHGRDRGWVLGLDRDQVRVLASHLGAISGRY